MHISIPAKVPAIRRCSASVIVAHGDVPSLQAIRSVAASCVEVLAGDFGVVMRLHVVVMRLHVDEEHGRPPVLAPRFASGRPGPCSPRTRGSTIDISEAAVVAELVLS
jgi:hypothetical protein